MTNITMQIIKTFDLLNGYNPNVYYEKEDINEYLPHSRTKSIKFIRKLEKKHVN